ncbi:MAG TPA: hypothetical protein VK138_17115 [Acidiferrobacterales bacterium]|nr:hypothetical protein [Acidiferrobacterales bacterium]
MTRLPLPQVLVGLALVLLCAHARAASPAILACDKPQVVGGYVLTCEIRFLENLAAEEILNVALYGDVDGVQTPSHLVVEAGRKAGRFQIMTHPVAAPQSVTIEVSSYEGIAMATTRRVLPAAVKRVTLNHSEVAGGIQAAGVVELTGPAPEHGIAVNIKSGDDAVALVPNRILIPANMETAAFNILSKPVAEDTMVVISATIGDEDTSMQKTPLLVTHKPKPDLVITNWAFFGANDEPLAQPLSGQKVNLCVNLANISFAKAPPSLLRLIVLGPGGRSFEQYEKAGSLKEGGKARVCLPLPPLEPDMNYTFNLYADAANMIVESDKSNNHLAFEYSYSEKTTENAVADDGI